MLKEKFQKVLILVAEKLDCSKIDWMLAGSANLVLHGMDYDPEDLDIIVSKKDEEKIKSLFSEFKQAGIRRFPHHEGEGINFVIEGVIVEFSFESKNGVYRNIADKKGLCKIKFCGYEIPCFGLKNEEAAYAALGRTKKSNAIDNFLEKNGSNKHRKKRAAE